MTEPPGNFADGLGRAGALAGSLAGGYGAIQTLAIGTGPVFTGAAALTGSTVLAAVAAPVLVGGLALLVATSFIGGGSLAGQDIGGRVDAAVDAVKYAFVDREEVLLDRASRRPQKPLVLATSAHSLLVEWDHPPVQCKHIVELTEGCTVAGQVLWRNPWETDTTDAGCQRLLVWDWIQTTSGKQGLLQSGTVHRVRICALDPESCERSDWSDYTVVSTYPAIPAESTPTLSQPCAELQLAFNAVEKEMRKARSSDGMQAALRLLDCWTSAALETEFAWPENGVLDVGSQQKCPPCLIVAPVSPDAARIVEEILWDAFERHEDIDPTSVAVSVSRSLVNLQRRVRLIATCQRVPFCTHYLDLAQVTQANLRYESAQQVESTIGQQLLAAELRRKEELLQLQDVCLTTAAELRRDLSSLILKLEIVDRIPSWHYAELEVSTAGAEVRRALKQRKDSKMVEVKALETVYNTKAVLVEKCLAEAARLSLGADLQETLAKLEAKKEELQTLVASDNADSARLEHNEKEANQAARKFDEATKAHVKMTRDEEMLLEVRSLSLCI
jgi:hypothetical protein